MNHSNDKPDFGMDLAAHQHNPYSRRVGTLPPIWKNTLDKGIHVTLYRNGDDRFPGKTVTLNKKQFRTFEAWLSDLSNNMRLRNGPVWRVYTPTNGTRKDDFDDFQEGQRLVLAGQERFKPLRYDQITPSERRKSPPFKYDASPVYHARQLQCSGKINKIDTHSVLITVWPNGQYLRGPRRVLIPPRVMKTNNIYSIISEVNNFLKDDIVGTVEKLYMPNGIKVSDADQIVQNCEYIACKRHERLSLKGFRSRPAVESVSPRESRRKLPSLGNSTHNSSPEHSNPSTGQSLGNGYGPRRRAQPRNHEDQVFPARPVKHTRNAQQVDLDKDEGGLFKAKQNNRNTHGAREIQDSRHTKTEVPVDQQVAKEVEDEAIDNKDDPRYNNRYNNGRAPQRGGGMMAKPNSKRPPQHAAPPPAKDPRKDRELELARNQSATKIQSNYRGYRTRKQLRSGQQPRDDNEKEQHYGDAEDNGFGYTEQRAASQIQAGYRGYKTRKDMKDKNEAATTIQSSARGRNSRKGKQDPEKDAAAKDIQSAYRGHRSRNSNRKDDKTEEDEAAKKIQSAYRGHRTRSQTREPTKQSTNLLDEEDKAATKIQSRYRGYKARKEYKESKEAAQDIQSAYRGHQSRRGTSPQKNQQDDDPFRKEEEAATKIQSNFKGYKARKEYKEKKEAAQTIQSGYRGHQSRSQSQRTARDDDDELRKENEAATKIQASYRGHKVRKETQNTKQSPVKDMTKEDTYDDLAKENKAATKIQSNYRGYRQRKEFQRTRAAAN